MAALKMIARFGRTTDIRAAKRLESKRLIVITRIDRLPGEWNKPGAKAAFGFLTEEGEKIQQAGR